MVSLPARWQVGPRHILLVQDDLAGQEHLLRMAARLARRLGAGLLVEHVLERGPGGGPALYTPTDPRTAKHLIDRLLDRLQAEGVPAQAEVTVTLSGLKSQAILAAAVESGADLVIVEAPRLWPFLPLGGLGTVRGIVRSGCCPVLLVPAVPRPSLALRLRSALHRLWSG